jgi:hypothetical protein
LIAPTTRTKERAAGLFLLALMAAHTAAHPDRGAWVLLSACDIASLATALGLLAGWRGVVGVAFLFQIAISLPAFFVGLATATYAPNATSVAIHLLPPVAGGWVVARSGLPRRATAIALAVYLLAVLASLAFSPPALNANLVFTVWPPLQRRVGSRVVGLMLFHGIGPLVLLSIGEVALRRWLPRALSSSPAPSPVPRPDIPE